MTEKVRIIVIFSCDHSMNRGLRCTITCVLLEGVDKTVNKRFALAAMKREKKSTSIKFPEEKTKILSRV